MARKTLIRSKTLPYHVTARANNREPFHCSMDRTWRVLEEHCYEAGLLWGLRVHSLLLMPNHVHMLASTPQEDLGVIMEHVMRSVTKALNRISGRSGRVFGGPYHWTLIDTPIYFAHAFKYVYRNPVRAGICERVEEYRFSTLSGQLGESPLHLPLYYPYGSGHYPGVPEFDGMRNWLNRPFRKEHEEAIRKALKRTEFLPPKQGWKRTFLDLKSPASL